MKRILHLLTGLLIFLFIGITLAWSIFVVPLEEALNATRSQTSLCFTLNVLTFSVGSILAGKLIQKTAPANLIRIVAVIIFTSFFLLSFANALWQVFVLYGILAGIGIGMGYNVAVSTFPKWMPKQPATATGLLLMGYAFSTTLFAPVVNALTTRFSVFISFRFIGITCGAMLLLLSFFVRAPKEGELKEDEKNAANTSDDVVPSLDTEKMKAAVEKQTTLPDVETKTMLGTRLFWLSFISAVCSQSLGLSIINHNAPIMQEEMMITSTVAATIVSIAALFNGFARLGFGILFDKLGLKRAIYVISVLQCSAIALILLGSLTTSMVLYVPGACLMLLNYGCSATMLPSCIRYMFGNKYFSSNYAMLSLDSIINSLFPTVIGALQQASGSYRLPLVLLTLFSACAFGINVWFARDLTKYQEKLKLMR